MPFQIGGEPVDLHNLVIDTPRLLLKAITQKYTEEIFHHFTPYITRYMIPAPPQTIGDTKAFVATALTGLERGYDLHLVVCQRDSGEFLGLCGLHERAQPNEPELGIWLKKEAHGNGYGREAIMALTSWAEKSIDFERLIYPVDRRNVASRKIAQALGGKVVEERKETSMTGTELDELVYAIGRVPSIGT